MTINTNIQALIEEGKQAGIDPESAPDYAFAYRTLIFRLTAALSALSSLAETETEWEYGSRSRAVPTAIYPDDSNGWNAAEHYPEAWERVRRRKAGPWVEVV